MNICSHQRSLITVSSNSKFSISAGKVSRKSKTLDNELESCPRMKIVTFYHSLIPKHFLKVSKTTPCLQMGSNEVQGVCDNFMPYFNTAGQCQWLERETTVLGFQPSSLAFQPAILSTILSARLPPSRAQQHQLSSTSGCQKMEKNS